MKSLDEYGLLSNDWIQYSSKIGSVACSLGYLHQFSKLDNRINELVQSYFNQWQFVTVTYDKLHKLFKTLNEKSDEHDQENILSQYDIESTLNEIEFKNYSYLLIVSMKTYLDLFSCLVDIIQNQVIKDEHKMPDFHNFGRGRNEDNIPELISAFENFRDPNKYPWIALLHNVRNRIIHRGYSLKPKFSFRKSNDLNVQVFRGSDCYTDTITIEIGKLFNDFMRDMPLIEQEASNILTEKIVVLNKKLSLSVSFKYSGLINEYSYEETEPI